MEPKKHAEVKEQKSPVVLSSLMSDEEKAIVLGERGPVVYLDWLSYNDPD